MTDWRTDWDEHTTDPDDGGGPFCFWWEDMRSREVERLVHEAYARGVAKGEKIQVSELVRRGHVFIRADLWERVQRELTEYRNQEQIKILEDSE